MARTSVEVLDISQVKNQKELFILESLAQLKTPKEIVEEYKLKYPNENAISRSSIEHYKRSRSVVIEKLRIKYIKNVESIPIANEKVRLSRTEELYNKAVSIVNVDDKRALDGIEVSLKCLKEARDEVKGSESGSNNYFQFNQFNELDNNQLLEMKEKLEKKFIELSRKGEIYEVQSIEK